MITQLHLPSRERVAGRVDVIGMGTLAVAIVALTLLTSVAGTRYDWSSAPVLALAGITLLAVVVFVRWERSAADPVVSLRLFTERNFTVAAILGFLSGLIMFGAMTTGMFVLAGLSTDSSQWRAEQCHGQGPRRGHRYRDARPELGQLARCLGARRAPRLATHPHPGGSCPASGVRAPHREH